MKPKTLEIGIALATLLYGFAAFHAMAAWHEQRHAEIFENHGCEDIQISYNYLSLDGSFAETLANCPEESGETKHHKLHSFQEKLWVLYMAPVLLIQFLPINYLRNTYLKFT